MDPFLGPVAGALLAALTAGTALGVLRLHRVSTDWWRRRRAAAAPGGTPAAADAGPAPGGTGRTEALDPAVAPPVFTALAGAALVAAVATGLALAFGAASARLAAGPPLAPPLGFGHYATRSSSLAVFAVLALVAAPTAALVAAALDRGLARAVDRLRARAGGRAAAGDEASLAVPDLVATARALLPGAPVSGRGEPFGVGLAYAGLFAASVLGVGALLAASGLDARGGRSGDAAVAALAFLATPVFYAAAAERSHDALRARLRRDAAVRQLAVAPLWAIAGAVLVTPGHSGLVLVVAALVYATGVALALPGAGANPGAWPAPPLGGDRAEPAAAVRALSGLAHYAWLLVLAMLPFVLVLTPGPARWWATLFGLVGLVLFLAARNLLVRRAPRPAPGASSGPESAGTEAPPAGGVA